MNGNWRIMAGTLRAAVWKTTPIRGAVSIWVAFGWAIVSVAGQLARQYFQAGNSSFFTPYGLNSTVACTAIAASVVLLFTYRQRTLVLSMVFALDVLLNMAAIAAGRLAMIVHWPNFLLGFWTHTDTIILQFLLYSVWWIGAFTAILRSVDFRFYHNSVMRAAGVFLASSVAVALLPAYPTFSEIDFDYRSANLWEWTRAKLNAGAEAETLPHVDSARLELLQPTLLDAEMKRLLPERKGITDIYAIGIAGWSDQDVFQKEMNGGLAALEKSVLMDRGAIHLVNHIDTTERIPAANRTNFASAVHYIAGVMNRDEDVLLIFITSHGSQAGVALHLADAVNVSLSPYDIATVLDREGVKNRLVMISACYAGIFVKPLASPDSIVMTAADANSPSFGCSNERDWTYFGDAFFNQSVRPGVSLEQAFDDAKARISQWETRDGIPPSNPQAHFGRSLSEKLALKAGIGDPRITPAPAGDPSHAAAALLPDPGGR